MKEGEKKRKEREKRAQEMGRQGKRQGKARAIIRYVSVEGELGADVFSING